MEMRRFKIAGMLLSTVLLFSACNSANTSPALSPRTDNTSTNQAENQPSPGLKNAPAESASYLSGTYSNREYGFSIKYPGTWQVTSENLSKNALFAARTPDDSQRIEILVADGMRSTVYDWLMEQVNMEFYGRPSDVLTPDPQAREVALADGKTQGIEYDMGEAWDITGDNKNKIGAVFRGFEEDDHYLIARISGTDPNAAIWRQWHSIASTLTPIGTSDIRDTTDSHSGSLMKPVVLKNDALDDDPDYRSVDQIAVCHTTTFGGQVRSASTLLWNTYNWVASPLIILPGKQEMVSIVRDWTAGCRLVQSAGVVSRSVIVTYYRDPTTKKDEMVILNQSPVSPLLDTPGWGLATRFQPGSAPFIIQNIRIAGVACHTTGPLQEYDQKVTRIRILDSSHSVLWSKDYPWSYFRSSAAAGYGVIPKSAWKDIPVDNVTVKGVFTIELMADSDQCGKQPEGNSYFAVSYERAFDRGDSKSSSFISENGRRADPWIQLYDYRGYPVCFNLGIRVDGLQ
jgi:hypothetical protein